MGENVEACLKRISVCAKSGPVGLAFCALMICECFWGTNPKFFRTNHAYAIGVSGKGCREGRACTERGLLAPRNKAGSFATLVSRPGSDFFGFCRRPENNGAIIFNGDFFEVRISRTLGPISLGISLEILSIVDE